MIPFSSEYLLQYMATLDTKGYVDGLGKMDNETSKKGNNISGIFGKIGSKIGSIITPQRLAVAGLTAFTYQMGKAVKQMILYEKSLDKVNTLLKVGKSELQGYGAEFRNLSARIGTDELDMLEGTYQALSAGVKKDDILGFMEIASKGAIAGFTDTQTSITGLTSILNAYKLEMSEASNVMDLLLTIQNKGVTTLGELGAYMGEVTPISSMLGISLNEVGAAIAQVTQNGNNTAKTMTMLKAMLAELSKEGQTADKNFRALTNKSFKDFIAEGNTLADALNLMEEYAKKNNKSLVDMFGSIEAGSAALNLTGKNADGFTEKLNDMGKSAGELEVAYTLATANISSEWKKFTGMMGKHWQSFVNVMQEPITLTLRTVRQTLDGEDNTKENIERKKAELLDINNEIARLRQEKKDYIQSGNVNITDREIFEKKIDRLYAKGKKLEIELEPIFKQEKIDTENKKFDDFAKDIQSKMSTATEFEKNGYRGREAEYKNFLLNLKKLKAENDNVYLGDFGFSNEEELNKKIESIQIAGAEVLEAEKKNAEDLKAFRETQAEDEKEFRQKQLEREWDFLAEQGALKLQGKISDEEFENEKQAHRLSESILQEEFEISQLEKERNFFEEKEGLSEKVVDIDKEIIKRKQDLINGDKKALATKLKWETWAESKKVDIQQKSADAILDCYTALAKGQIKSVEDFKNFAQMSLAELLLAKGQEHAAKAVSHGVQAVSNVALSASYTALGRYDKAAEASVAAKTEMFAAAKNAAQAAAFGVAASAISTSESSSGGGSSSNGKTTTSYDDGINSRTDTAKESEGTVYIDVSDSQMAKMMIKNIEKELNDGYNVTLIGKKK